MGWIIYISGFILNYLICKFIRNRGYQNTWGDVIATIFASLFSWGAIVVLLGFMGFVFLSKTIKIKNPPKWL